MKTGVNSFDRHMTAAAFAEAGEFDTATELLQEQKDAVKKPKKAPSPATRKKPYTGMIIFGALSLSGYAALMTHQGWVGEEFTMGGWHAAYPVVTAVIFSFIHGAFASNMLTILGIEPKNKK
jgi:hypothetical protein